MTFKINKRQDNFFYSTTGLFYFFIVNKTHLFLKFV